MRQSSGQLNRFPRVSGTVRYVLIACLLLAMFPVLGSAFHSYTQTSYRFVRENWNSTILLSPDDRSASLLIPTTKTRYRITLDANSTVLLKIYSLQKKDAFLQPPCNTTGTLVFEEQSAKYVNFTQLGPGYYEYILCNLGSSAAYGNFEIASYQLVTTTTYHDLGTFVQFLAIPATVWGAFWILQHSVPRGKASSAVRAFAWIVIAPVLLLVITSGMMSVVYWVSRGDQFGALALTDFALSLIGMILQGSIKSGWWSVYSIPASMGITLGLCLYFLRLGIQPSVTKKVNVHPLARRLVRPPTGIMAQLFRPAVSYLFPDKPNVAVFVRLMVASLLIVETIITAPLGLVSGEIPYVGSLVSYPVSSILTSNVSVFFCIVVMLPVVICSLTWQPRSPNKLFRAASYTYFVFLIIAIVALIDSMVNDYAFVVAQVYIWMTMLPSALLAGYITWILDFVVRSATKRSSKAESVYRATKEGK